MITRFEKRMLTVLLAALMCVPVSAMPVVQANAEETQAVESQEDISAEETQQGGTDTTGADTAQEADASDSSSTGASDEKAGMDVDEDGAFIPLEEEPQALESGQAQEKQVQKEQAQEQKSSQEDMQSEEKKADSDLPDEDLPEIVLPADGSQVRRETEFDGTTNSVRYIFRPDKTDAYFLNILEGNGYTVYHKQSGDGWSSVQSADSVVGIDDLYEMQAGDIYYIDIWGEEGVTSTSVWNFGKAEEIRLGSYDTDISEPGQAKYYSLSCGASGVYWVKCGDYEDESTEIKLAQRTHGWWISYDNYVYLNQNEPCYVEVSHSDDNWTGAISWEMGKTEPIPVKTGQVVTTYTETGTLNPLYSFIPEKDGEYGFSTEWPMSVQDSEWNDVDIFKDRMNLKAGETYYIYTHMRGDWKFEWQIGMVEPIEVRTGVEYKRCDGQLVKYEFTPAESGRYYFQFDQETYLVIDDVWAKDGYDHWVDLEAGTTYEIWMNVYGQETTWSVNKSEIKDIKENVDYTTATGEGTEYRFTPGVSGSYFLTSSDLGECEVYNSDGSVVDAYCYQDETGFGANMHLEKGKTYYIHVIPEEENAVWKLEALRESGDFSYRTLEDGTVEILKYAGTSAEVAIPENIEGKTVASVGYGAFIDNETITSVSIPGKVTDIQYSAFQSCVNLKNVRFATGSKLKSIGSGAFSGTALSTIVIPDSVTEMGTYVFAGCESLNSVTLGKGLKGIEDRAFMTCSSLKTISLPDNITYIGKRAFYGTGLSQIDIPDSVVSIEEWAFGYCTQLKKANITNRLAYVASGAFAGCDLTEFVIGNKVEKIQSYAFEYNENLKTVTIPNSVTEIEYSAFNGCESLMDIDIPDSVEAIGQYAFNGTAWYEAQDDGLVYAGKVLYAYKGDITEKDGVIRIAEGTKGIAGHAFLDKEGLTKVIIPQGVTNIGRHAFTGCDSMTEITIPETVTRIDPCAVGYTSLSGETMKDFTIYGVKGSAAQTYAEENDFKFVAIEPSYTKGDVNGDGEVTIVDLRIVLRKVCNKIELNSTQTLAADVVKDNKVDIQDLRKILRFVCKKINTFE